MSLVRPPDPDLLQNMSVREQREFTARWAERALSGGAPGSTPGSTPGSQAGSRPGSRPGSRSGSRTGSRRSSATEETGETKGILKTTDGSGEAASINMRSILKSSPVSACGGAAAGVRGILKPDCASDTELDVRRGILKRENVAEGRGERTKGILKRESSLEETPPVRSALKQLEDVGTAGATAGETHGILKKESSLEETSCATAIETRGILKEPTFQVPAADTQPHGILKAHGILQDQLGAGHGILQDGLDSRTQVNGEIEIAAGLEQDIGEEREPDVSTAAASTGNGVASEVGAGEEKEEEEEVRRERTQPGVTKDEEKEEGGVVRRERTQRGSNVRRRAQRDSKTNERYHTQPVEGAEGEQAGERRSAAGHARHFTQPVTCEEKQEARGVNGSPNTPKSSITERLALLQRSGATDWKRRIGKSDALLSPPGVRRRPAGAKADRPYSIAVDSPPGRLAVPDPDTRPLGRAASGSIADRLNCLEGAQEGWRGRVAEKDMKQFTVEGKMTQAGKVSDSPLMSRKHRILKSQLNRESESSDGSAPSSPVKPLGPPACALPPHLSDNPLSASSPDLFATISAADLNVTVSDPDVASEDVAPPPPTVVAVPTANDDAFSAFFATSTTTTTTGTKEVPQVSVDDFNEVFISSEDILVTTRRPAAQKRRAATSRNPLRQLAARGDLLSGYTQVRTDVAERELRRIKRQQIAGTVTLAQEALAGLASKENFSQVALRKTASFGSSTPGAKLQPYKSTMLMHVKGRRHCAMRLVDPTSRSINSGDCFVLLVPDHVYVWIGEYSNMMEKAKAVEVANTITQKKELGCKAGLEPICLYETKEHVSSAAGFWEPLGGRTPYQDPGPVEEDEMYEQCVEEMTRVYVVQTDQLLLVPEYSGVGLKHEILNTKRVYVFDFGSEMYVWTGKQVPFAERKVGIRLASELWQQGYDYTGHEVNLLCPLIPEEKGGLAMTGSARPSWALLGKVNENMETVLFREKFINWPDAGHIIKVKGSDSHSKVDVPSELKPCDVTKMVTPDDSPVTLLLENNNVGRGCTWEENVDGLRREYTFQTLSVSVWHVLEYERYVVDPTSHGQFHDHDSYVVRWQYKSTQTGVRTLKGGAATHHGDTGRERCAYFFWQGVHSSVTEKGAAALMTVELDEECGPQVRVTQGKEPPCFLQLFQSSGLAVYHGHREAPSSSSRRHRLFIVRNERPGEAYLSEVACTAASLRSRASLVMVRTRTGRVTLWHGGAAGGRARERAREVTATLRERCPAEMESVKLEALTELEEGKESAEFWRALRASPADRSAYSSRLTALTEETSASPRLFHFTSVSGVFEAVEVLNPARCTDAPSPYPFTQEDLYHATQPALFLLDVHSAVYVWAGWWPSADSELTDNVSTGSALARFNLDLRNALHTTLSYCHEKRAVGRVRASLVYGGLEPLHFTNLFAVWRTDDSVQQLNVKEGRRVDEEVDVVALLARLTRTRYTRPELQQRPLPEGADPLRLETYLCARDFEEVLGMTSDEFHELPEWKQVKLKKDVDLF